MQYIRRRFWTKRNVGCQDGKNKMRKQKSRGVGILSPNLVTDEAQSLRTVMTELPELMWSPMALSKLKWEAMKGKKKNHKKRPSKKSTDCVRYICFLAFFSAPPPVSHLKFPTPWGLPVRRPPTFLAVLKPLPFNLWDSHIWKGWAWTHFKLLQGLIQTRPDSLLCSEHKVSAVKSH